jgi:nitronate monooxygenase
MAVADIASVLRTELPILQAPMAGVQGHALAVAVCNAGGLGALPCAMLTPETMAQELRLIREQAPSRPFNVNFFCHTPPSPDARREAAWREALAPYYTEFGLDVSNVPAGAGRAPFTAQSADALEPFKPAVVSFHFGLPEAALLDRVRGWGSKIIASATTLAEGRWLAARGVDAVIAQGVEAGGHRGIFLSDDLSTQIGTLALVRQLVKRLDVPVIAAGGIADAQGVKAAFALGAAAVQVGTAYMLCPEATTSQVHRAALKSEAAQHTALTNLFTGRPARGIVNRLMRELGPISDRSPAFPLATAAIAPLRAKAEAQGSGDFSPLWSGQDPSGCKEVSAAQLTRELMGL